MSKVKIEGATSITCISEVEYLHRMNIPCLNSKIKIKGKINILVHFFVVDVVFFFRIEINMVTVISCKM